MARDDFSIMKEEIIVSINEQLVLDVSARYWDLGNMIAAFSAIQMLGFLYAMGEKTEFLAKVRENWALVAWLTAASGLIYCTLIYSCYYAESTVLASNTLAKSIEGTSWWALMCRQVIVALMTILGIGVLFLDRKQHPNDYLRPRKGSE